MTAQKQAGTTWPLTQGLSQGRRTEDEVRAARRAAGLLLRSPALDAGLCVVPHEGHHDRDSLLPEPHRALRRVDLVDPLVISLRSSPNRAIAQDSSHGIQRRLDQ